MTRINAGISPDRLCDHHLVAEYREIARLVSPSDVGRPIADGPFRLGPGHVSFFRDKLMYVFRRWRSLRDECARRGFSVEESSRMYEERFLAAMRLRPDLFGEWDDASARTDVQERILTRIAEQKGDPRYRRSPISKEAAALLLREGRAEGVTHEDRAVGALH